jgi:RNA polymerase sigma-70 factor (ECF subfamily)
MSIALIERNYVMDLELPSPPTDAWEGGWPQSPEEFEKLVEAYLDRLVRYALRRLGDLQDAEDVVQEVFLRAFKDRHKRRGISDVGPYLYRMTANACTDLQRRPRPVRVSLEEINEAEMVCTGKTPSQAARAAEGLRRAESLLQRLPAEQAEAVRLRVFDDLQLNEIAEVVGCSANTVGSRLRYGFRKLRQIVSGKKG